MDVAAVRLARLLYTSLVFRSCFEGVWLGDQGLAMVLNLVGKHGMVGLGLAGLAHVNHMMWLVCYGFRKVVLKGCLQEV